MSNEQTELSIDEPVKAGAIFSPDKKYRYLLWRIWNNNLPKCGFIMLNPSKADAYILDPTVSRCIGFAKQWGYGSLFVCNIFALRSTDPQELYKVDDPVGPDNDSTLLDLMKKTDFVITAWGNHGTYMDRGNTVLLTILPEYSEKMAYLGVSNHWQPLHPLYLSKDVLPVKYKVDKNKKEGLTW